MRAATIIVQKLNRRAPRIDKTVPPPPVDAAPNPQKRVPEVCFLSRPNHNTNPGLPAIPPQSLLRLHRAVTLDQFPFPLGWIHYGACPLHVVVCAGGRGCNRRGGLCGTVRPQVVRHSRALLHRAVAFVSLFPSSIHPYTWPVLHTCRLQQFIKKPKLVAAPEQTGHKRKAGSEVACLAAPTFFPGWKA